MKKEYGLSPEFLNASAWKIYALLPLTFHWLELTIELHLNQMVLESTIPPCAQEGDENWVNTFNPFHTCISGFQETENKALLLSKVWRFPG